MTSLVATSYSASALLQSVSSDHTHVEMIFWSVQQTDFGTYYLTAENDIGSAEVTIMLHPAYDSAHPLQVPAGRMEQMQQLLAKSPQYCEFTSCSC